TCSRWKRSQRVGKIPRANARHGEPTLDSRHHQERAARRPRHPRPECLPRLCLRGGRAMLSQPPPVTVAGRRPLGSRFPVCYETHVGQPEAETEAVPGSRAHDAETKQLPPTAAPAPPCVELLSPGDLVAERYEIAGRLGR